MNTIETIAVNTRTPPLYWVRVGDAGEYESFDDLHDLVDYLNLLGVGRVDHWRSAGLETPNYWGGDYVSLYRGDTNAEHVSDLLPDERVTVEDGLRESFL